MTNPHLRRATPGDALAIARLHRQVVQECLPFLPHLHTAAEDLQFFSDRFLPEHNVWVWEDGGIRAYCGFGAQWLDHLYVDATLQGRGVGSALLNKAKDANDVLNLWVFQRNKPAISFYERHDFELVEQTHGLENEEKEPDARYVWSRA